MEKKMKQMIIEGTPRDVIMIMKRLGEKYGPEISIEELIDKLKSDYDMDEVILR